MTNWTIKEDIVILLRGLEANELEQPFLQFVEAADQLALAYERGASLSELNPLIDTYWKARYQEISG